MEAKLVQEPTALDHIKTTEEEEEFVSIRTKLSYGIGTLPQTATNVVGFFWNKFLLEVALLSPNYAATALLLAKLWDALMDPVVGALTDRTQTRFGRRRPWLLGASPFVGVAFFLLWLTPSLDEGAKFAYFFLIFCLQQTVATAYYVPYASLTMDLATTARQRNSLTQYRFLVGGFGAIVYMALIGVLTSDNFTAKIGKARAYQLSAIIIAVIMTIAALVCFFGVRERDYDKIEREQHARVPLWRAFFNVIRNKEYLFILTITAFGWLSLQLVQVNLQLYCSYALQEPTYFTYGLLVALFLGSLFVPLTRIITNRFGKKVAWCCGTVFMWVFSLFAYFAPANNIPVLFVVCILFGFAVAVLFFVPWAFLPDVIDLEELNTGVRQEGVYYSVFGLFENIASAVGIAISNYILSVAGYDSENPRNNIEVVAPVIRSVIGFGPLILMTISLVFLYFYPINLLFERQIQARIIAKRAGVEAERASLLSSNDDATATNLLVPAYVENEPKIA